MKKKMFQSPCGCELQQVEQCPKKISSVFQYPCGCELQLLLYCYYEDIARDEFQYPCGCELQPNFIRLKFRRSSFNTLAGVSCNGKIL